MLVGTIYPLFIELSGGAPVSVGPPYFDAAATPLLMVLLLLVPLAPFLPGPMAGQNRL